MAMIMKDEKKLSKGLLELKFMKRSKEKVKRQEEDEETQNLYEDELAKLHDGADRVVMINSYYDCMNFLPCRLSFGGADTEIEKLNEDKLTGLYQVEKKKKEDSTGMEVDITAEEFKSGPRDDSTLNDRFSVNNSWNRDNNRGRGGDHRGGGRGGRDRGRDHRGGGGRGGRGRGGEHRGGGRGGGDRRGDHHGGNRGGDHHGGNRGGRDRSEDRRGGGRGGRGGSQGSEPNNANRFDESKFGKSYQHKILPIKDKGNPAGQMKRESGESERQSKFLKPDN